MGTGGNRQYLISVAQIAEMLSARTPELCQALLPQGVREGEEWCVGSTAGERGRSLKVHLRGPTAGVWKDFASDQDTGDALDLVAACLFGGDKKKAIPWARSWLGLDGRDPGRLAQTRQAVAAKDDGPGEEAAEAKRRAAARIYLTAQADLRGTPVWTYLAGRGVDLGRLLSVGALRYHPALKHAISQRRWPAMVASAVSLRTGQLAAIHRTWLAEDGKGKAPVEEPKMTLGSPRGAAISISKGTRVDPTTGEVRKGLSLRQVREPCWVHLTEGLEDALTVAVARTDVRVMCAISLANMGSLVFPEMVAGVVLHRQNDPPGSKAALLFDRIAARFCQMGLRVRVVVPPPGTKDVNDLVRQSRQEVAS